jgi:hypothetical protein
MTKIKVPAYALQPGDKVGSGEVVSYVIINSINWRSNKCMVVFNGKYGRIWGKYTQITVEREG